MVESPLLAQSGHGHQLQRSPKAAFQYRLLVKDCGSSPGLPPPPPLILFCPPVRLCQPGASTLPFQRELFDGSVPKAGRIQKGVEDCLWHPVFRPAYCAARSGRGVPQTDQTRPESCCVVAVGSRGMAGRADRIARRMNLPLTLPSEGSLGTGSRPVPIFLRHWKALVTLGIDWGIQRAIPYRPSVHGILPNRQADSICYACCLPLPVVRLNTPYPA